MTRTRKHFRPIRSTKKYRSYKKSRRNRVKKQRGGLVTHTAVTNPLYGALWYSPISYQDLLPSIS